MSTDITFSSATPIPREWSPEKRVTQLEATLDPKSPSYDRPEQHVNIRKLIDLYKNGQIRPGEQVWVLEGRVVDRTTALKGPGWATVEVRSSSFRYENATN